MDRDILFALAILKKEYSERRKHLVNTDLEPRLKDNVLADLENISRAIHKIEQKFPEKDSSLNKKGETEK